MRYRAIGLLFLAAFTGWTQEFRATLVGRVADPSGAPAPKAAVPHPQQATNVQHKPASTESGDYTLPFLPPGDYRLEVEMPGFRRFVRDGITLRVQDRASIDVT